MDRFLQEWQNFGFPSTILGLLFVLQAQFVVHVVVPPDENFAVRWNTCWVVLRCIQFLERLTSSWVLNWESFYVVRCFLLLFLFLWGVFVIIPVLIKLIEFDVLIHNVISVFIEILVHDVFSPLSYRAIFHKSDTFFAVDVNVNDILVLQLIHLFRFDFIAFFSVHVTTIFFVSPPEKLVAICEPDGEVYSASYFLEHCLGSFDNFRRVLILLWSDT